MFPGSDDLRIYDFTVVNKCVFMLGGVPQGVKGQRLTINCQGQEPSLGETDKQEHSRTGHLLCAVLATAWGSGKVASALHPPVGLQPPLVGG